MVKDVATSIRSFRVLAPYEEVLRKISQNKESSGVYVKELEKGKIALTCGETLFLRTTS